MEAFLIILGLYLLLALVALPIWVIIKLGSHAKALRQLQDQARDLESEIMELRRSDETRSAAATPAPIPPVEAPPSFTPTQPAIIPPTPIMVEPLPPPVAPVPPQSQPIPPVAPPPLVPPSPRPVFVPLPRTLPGLNWEQFMGAKLFAWLGGLALFLGVAFFVKYSFEHNLIPPEVRVALGFVMGLALIVGGLKIPRERYAITAQTLIAAGVVSLYAVTFACNSIYHFAFFSALPTFLLMVLITATAFLIAVRLEARVVAILGMLGGFLTPVLLSTGQDNPVGLFGYLALLDAGLVAVALRTGWRYLVPLSAGGTVLILLGWTDKFFTAEKGPVAMTVCLVFSALYLAAAELARRREDESDEFTWTAVALPLVGFAYAFFFFDYPALTTRAPLFFGYVVLLDVALLILTWRQATLPRIHLLSGAITFVLLALWTTQNLTDELLPWALGVYLVFAALHTAFPLLLERWRPDSTPTWWSQIFPPLTLLLMLVPLLKIETVSFLLWPAMLLVDVLAIALAVISASLAAVAAVLVLTLLAAGLCIFKLPVAGGLEPTLLLVIAGFAVFFFAASFWLVRKLGDRLPQGAESLNSLFGDTRAQIPAFASLLPFILLIMACARLTVPDPATIFGLGLLLVVLTLGLARILVIAWLPACALAGMAALEYVWHTRHFDPADAAGPLGWYAGFTVLFAVYPFLFRRHFERCTGPWAVAALSGVAHFWMVYQAIKLGWPNDLLGVVPALFALAPLASLFVMLKTTPGDSPARLNQLAWFGAAALFFITLIFPIQFDRQWLTVAWALEGAALLWLFQRVPHAGLRAVGTVLLCTAFVRLALNPAVFSYHIRGETPILNWYLYAYGLTVAALFFGARLLGKPDPTGAALPQRVLGA
ncbi:MAG: DUF2339 domain-containing protein, partial [Akkermansiaceae bacterium]|nr:DUF2339 domain-containing protein [Akkermansiaceae bacterium]